MFLILNKSNEKKIILYVIYYVYVLNTSKLNCFASPYKNEGDSVKKGDVIGLIEVMKSFHEVHADADGTITAFHADNEDAVMAGQPLATLSI